MMTMKQQILYAYCNASKKCKEQTEKLLEEVKNVYIHIFAPKNIHTELMIYYKDNDVVFSYEENGKTEVVKKISYEKNQEFEVFLTGLKKLLDDENLENEIDEKELILKIKKL